MVNGDIVVPEDIARNTSGRDESVHVMTNASGGVASIVFWEEDGGAASAMALSEEHPAVSVSALAIPIHKKVRCAPEESIMQDSTALSIILAGIPVALFYFRSVLNEPRKTEQHHT